jgi:hypothetical protein
VGLKLYAIHIRGDLAAIPLSNRVARVLSG